MDIDDESFSMEDTSHRRTSVVGAAVEAVRAAEQKRAAELAMDIQKAPKKVVRRRIKATAGSKK